jgi:gamma-glutamyltranspeptidase/glutathione hydrolase
VPGELRGLEYLHKRYGKLSWLQVFQPAIHVARHGFQVDEDFNWFMDYFSQNPKTNFLVNDKSWAIDFAPNGTRVKTGDWMTRKRYANTLEIIAKEGPNAFYTGALANTTVKAVQSANGTITLEDLQEYKVRISAPVKASFRGFRMWASPAPASGAIALSIMNILAQYPAKDAANINISTHRLVEAMRFGYGQRTLLGDPFAIPSISKYEQSILTQASARSVRNRISDDRTLPISAYNPSNLTILTDHGTSHIVTSDASGLAITLTSTVNLIFGSQVMVPETGVVMNDEMDDFSQPGRKNAFGFVPSPSNFIRPGARPLSSITPVIVEYPNGTLYFVTGAAGGSKILSSTVQSLWHVLQYGRSAREALSAPRLHDQLIPNMVQVEWAFDNQTTEFMIEAQHNVTWTQTVGSSVQAIRRLANGSFEAVGEPRQRISGGFVF